MKPIATEPHKLSFSEEFTRLRRDTDVARASNLKVKDFRKIYKEVITVGRVFTVGERRFEFIDKHPEVIGRGWWLELPDKP